MPHQTTQNHPPIPESSTTHPTTYSVEPLVYPRASTLLLFLGDYYTFYSQPIPQLVISDSCGNTWKVLAGPTNWAANAYDLRTTITVATSVQEQQRFESKTANWRKIFGSCREVRAIKIFDYCDNVITWKFIKPDLPGYKKIPRRLSERNLLNLVG